MADPRKVRHWQPMQGVPLAWLSEMLLYKALGEDTADRYALSWSMPTPGIGSPRYILTREEVGFYVLEGMLTFTAGNQSVPVSAGDFINISRGTPHAFVPSADDLTRFLAFHAPAGFDQFQFEAGREITDRAATLPPVTKMDHARMRTIAPKYGIETDPSAEAFRRPPKMTVCLAGEGRRLAVVGDSYRFLVTGFETGGSYALWEATVPPGGGPPLHVHSREDEAFFILDGNMTFQIEDKTITAPTGTFVNLPSGVRHAFKNQSKAIARMLIAVAPAGLEKMFEETGTALPDLNTPIPPVNAHDIQKLLAVAPRYGIEIFTAN